MLCTGVMSPPFALSWVLSVALSAFASHKVSKRIVACQPYLSGVRRCHGGVSILESKYHIDGFNFSIKYITLLCMKHLNFPATCFVSNPYPRA